MTSGCGTDKEESGKDSSGGTSEGKIGKSVKANGKEGKMIEGSWTYDDVPEKYKNISSCQNLIQSTYKAHHLKLTAKIKGNVQSIRGR